MAIPKAGRRRSFSRLKPSARRAATVSIRTTAGSGTWSADNTYIAKICFFETPYVLTIKLDFSNDKLRLDSEWNVAFGPTKPGQLVGELK